MVLMTSSVSASKSRRSTSPRDTQSLPVQAVKVVAIGEPRRWVAEETRWKWNISSAPLDGVSADKDNRLHVDGRFHLRSSKDEALVAEFSRFERLVNYSSCAALLATAGRDGGRDGVEADVLQGRDAYLAFSEFVDYSEAYRGVKSVVGRSDECAGRVHRRRSGDTWLDVLLDDCFGQVSGLWANCMTDIEPSDMHIATGCEMLMRSPRVVLDAGQAQDTWHVYARSTRRSNTAYTTDVFVFNAANGQLAEVLLGIQYTQVPKAAMVELLYVGNETAAPEPFSPVYHIDNPVGQSWKDMSPVLAEPLGGAPERILPFRDWLRRVSRSPRSERENPPARIMDFLDRTFERISCGGLILDTSKAGAFQDHGWIGAYTSFTDPNHTVMQRVMLELIYIMGAVLLYRPFLDLMKPKNRECQVALNVCRRLAVRSVGAYVEVDREMQEGGRLYDDQPVASGLYTGTYKQALLGIDRIDRTFWKSESSV
ncbi:hypothetical protein LX32DRAFT_699880 [Colletotrichum zoysiae]|uniref:PKS/mFAS DH domain-containing protein n=1 Tax=Colletotrichum zoysiae TaxID=1216348 RepID=A0AAD9H3M4_9PEZI|nr:hypothetical protein LX32DRAFT_699880 [Colletotrichum zoysiae]